jgi:hypothetical protein
MIPTGRYYLQPMTLHPANSQQTSLENYYGHNFIDYSNSAVSRRTTHLALQYRLGLLSNRWTRSDFYNHPCPRLTGEDLEAWQLFNLAAHEEAQRIAKGTARMREGKLDHLLPQDGKD